MAQRGVQASRRHTLRLGGAAVGGLLSAGPPGVTTEYSRRHQGQSAGDAAASQRPQFCLCHDFEVGNHYQLVHEVSRGLETLNVVLK